MRQEKEHPLKAQVSTTPHDLLIVSHDRGPANTHHVDGSISPFSELFAEQKKQQLVEKAILGCQSSGGMDGCEQDRSEQKKKDHNGLLLSMGLDAESDPDGKGREKSKDYSSFGGVSSGCEVVDDPKVYTSFEAAGLPRKELSRLVRVLQDSALAGKRNVTLSLRLSELGNVKFDVRIEGNKVFINATVENQRAATAMALAISELKDRLLECDLVLERFDVSTQSDKRRSRSRTGNGAQREQDANRAESKTEEAIATAGTEAVGEGGIIHIIA